MHVDDLRSCNNMAHVSYTAESFSQLVVWHKMTNYSQLLWATSKLWKFTTNMHFIYLLFPEVQHSDKQTPAKKHEIQSCFPAIIIQFCLFYLFIYLYYFFFNQGTNLEMSITANKCYTVHLNPPPLLWKRLPLQALNSV